MPIEGALRDVAVLLIDEQPFRRGYVAGAIIAAGGEVLGPFDAAEAALDHLTRVPALPRLAYVGVRAGPADALVARLVAHGLGCVAVCGDPTARPAPARSIVLRPPLAAFQVVEALQHLHRTCA